MTPQSTSMGGTTMATGGTRRRRAAHDGDGRHDSDKGQQGDRMHNDFDGRHDDDKGQQGNRRHNNGNEQAG